MLFLPRTFPTIAENLAFDEALLVEADSRDDKPSAMPELLRVWQAEQPFIVLGRSSRAAVEIEQGQVAAEKVPVYRRISGGATVAADVGCLFYALLIDLRLRPALRMLDQAHDFVMKRMVSALKVCVPGIDSAGTCDLVVGDLKVSGNSVRVGRDWMLYHGTLLCHMDLAIIARWLKHPPREPDYRGHRGHANFVCNLGLTIAEATACLRNGWEADRETMIDLPARVSELVSSRYSRHEWTYER